MSKILMAYTGDIAGLVCLNWLNDTYGGKIAAVTVNLGQPDFLNAASDTAIESGATDTYIVDLREKFLTNFAFKMLRGGVSYQDSYFLSDAIAIFAIAQQLVSVAREENADTIAIASREDSESFVRFNIAFKDLAPDKKIIAPLKELGLYTYDQILASAKKAGIQTDNTYQHKYNTDTNLWGSTIQVDISLWNNFPESVCTMTRSQASCPDTEDTVELEFFAGIPVSLNGKITTPVEIVDTLNKIAGDHGIGRAQVSRTKLTGTLAHYVHEAPAAAVLYRAHKALESITLDQNAQWLSKAMGCYYTELALHGRWFSLQREAIDDFFARLQTPVSGKVILRLQKGMLSVLKCEKHDL